jgi:hypothetical protein
VSNWWPDEEDTFRFDKIQHPPIADDSDLYKLEKWTSDGSKVDRLVYAGKDLAKATDLFWAAIKYRPKIRLTIRRRTHVLRQWPPP